MAFTSVEIIALVMIIFAVIKMIVLLINPKSWMDFAKSLLGKNGLLGQIIGLILGAVVLYYLIQAGFTIIDILAVTAFVALLVMIGLARNVGSLLKKYETQIRRGNLWKENWFYTLIWIVLLIWGIVVLFF